MGLCYTSHGALARMPRKCLNLSGYNGQLQTTIKDYQISKLEPSNIANISNILHTFPILLNQYNIIYQSVKCSREIIYNMFKYVQLLLKPNSIEYP